MCLCVCFSYRLFEAVREPAVSQHSNHRGRRALQVLKGVHQDEVQHDVEKVHTHHLQTSGNKEYILFNTCTTHGHIRKVYMIQKVYKNTHPAALQLHLGDGPRFLPLSVEQHVLVALQEGFGTLTNVKKNIKKECTT